MKKEYIIPQMDVFVIKIRQQLLTGSPDGSNVSTDPADDSYDVL